MTAHPPLTRAELDELRAVHEASTPGKWYASDILGSRGVKNRIFGLRGMFVAHTAEGIAAKDGEQDALAIVTAHNNFDRLLATAERVANLERSLTKCLKWSEAEIVHVADADQYEADVAEAKALLGAALSRALGEEAGR